MKLHILKDHFNTRLSDNSILVTSFQKSVQLNQVLVTSVNGMGEWRNTNATFGGWTLIDDQFPKPDTVAWYRCNTWWRHQMETFSALLAICAGFNRGHKGQWRGALMFSLICVWIKGWVNNRDAGDLRRYRTHYDVTVMRLCICSGIPLIRLIYSLLWSVIRFFCRKYHNSILMTTTFDLLRRSKECCLFEVTHKTIELNECPYLVCIHGTLQP